MIPDRTALAAHELCCMECGHHMMQKAKWTGKSRRIGVFVKCVNRECFFYDRVFEASNQVPLYASTQRWEDL